jgi:hypothetical protein
VGSPLLEVSLASKKVNKIFEASNNGIRLCKCAFTIFKEFGYFVSVEEAIDLWIAQGLR